MTSLCLHVFHACPQFHSKDSYRSTGLHFDPRACQFCHCERFACWVFCGIWKFPMKAIQFIALTLCDAIQNKIIHQAVAYCCLLQGRVSAIENHQEMHNETCPNCSRRAHEKGGRNRKQTWTQSLHQCRTPAGPRAPAGLAQFQILFSHQPAIHSQSIHAHFYLPWITLFIANSIPSLLIIHVLCESHISWSKIL